jgi:hypothetical protein
VERFVRENISIGDWVLKRKPNSKTENYNPSGKANKK